MIGRGKVAVIMWPFAFLKYRGLFFIPRLTMPSIMKKFFPKSWKFSEQVLQVTSHWTQQHNSSSDQRISFPTASSWIFWLSFGPCCCPPFTAFVWKRVVWNNNNKRITWIHRSRHYFDADTERPPRCWRQREAKSLSLSHVIFSHTLY